MTKRDLFSEARARIDGGLSDISPSSEWIIFRGLCIVALSILAVAEAIYHGQGG